MPYDTPALNLQYVQNATPASGAVLNMDDNAQDGMLYIQPAGLLASLTVNLPSEANSRTGQIRSLATSKAVTVLTIAGAVTIMSAPASMALGACYTFQKIAPNTWIRSA